MSLSARADAHPAGPSFSAVSNRHVSIAAALATSGCDERMSDGFLIGLSVVGPRTIQETIEPRKGLNAIRLPSSENCLRIADGKGQ
jgi:hypothetical protein